MASKGLIWLVAKAARKRCALPALALIGALLLGRGEAFADNLPVVVAGGKHTCALSSLSGGTVSCWGDNTYGQLGDGTNVNRLVPTDLPGLSGVSALAAGEDHTCALIASTGGVKCWGYNNHGQLGDSSTNNSSTPVDVVDGSSNPLVGVAEVTAGAGHSCARFSAGGAVCWGHNGWGQLGSNSGGFADKLVATAVTNFTSDVYQISAGYRHTCLVKTSTKEVWCFGENVSGALGNSSYADSVAGVRAAGISSAVEVSAGNRFTCARLAAGELLCWGLNVSGNLGDGTTNISNVPVAVGSSPVGTMIDAGGGNGASTNFTCAALVTTGQAQCWGTGLYGVLGNGAEVQQTLPVNVSGLTGVVAIATGTSHSCAWIDTCTIRCWGLGTLGRLGTGGTANENTPKEIRTCDGPTPTPTSTPTPTATATPNETPAVVAPPAQETPDACRLVGSTCVPDLSLSNPYNPRPPDLTATLGTRKVTLVASFGKLALPIDPAQVAKLRALLERLLGIKIKNLPAAISKLQLSFVFTIRAAPKVSAAEVDTAAVPKKLRVETRSRRVTARLGPGSYIATVSVKIKTPRGKVVAASKVRSTSFTVR